LPYPGRFFEFLISIVKVLPIVAIVVKQKRTEAIYLLDEFKVSITYFIVRQLGKMSIDKLICKCTELNTDMGNFMILC
jgi:hypothetical protein